MIIWDEEISLHNVERFEEVIKQLLKSDSIGVILNLEKVSYMNSYGLGIIVNAVNNAKKLNKQLVIVNNRTTIKKIFGIVSFDSIVKVFSNEHEAKKFLSSAS